MVEAAVISQNTDAKRVTQIDAENGTRRI